MLDSFYEIVVLDDGDVVLQRSDCQETPLVRISFSAEASSYIEGHRIAVAKAMIDAAIETVEYAEDTDSSKARRHPETKTTLLH